MALFIKEVSRGIDSWVFLFLKNAYNYINILKNENSLDDDVNLMRTFKHDLYIFEFKFVLLCSVYVQKTTATYPAVYQGHDAAMAPRVKLGLAQ